MIWTTSDLHFCHDKLAVERGFSSTQEMNEVLVYAWNQVVNDCDLVYVLGDFGWKIKSNKNNISRIYESLKGTKVLIRGNHDANDVVNLNWRRVHELVEIVHNKQSITLCHYPIASWNKKRYGAFNLHGHMHGTFKCDRNQYDVGVDANDYTPISLEAACEKASRNEVKDGY